MNSSFAEMLKPCRQDVQNQCTIEGCPGRQISKLGPALAASENFTNAQRHRVEVLRTTYNSDPDVMGTDGAMRTDALKKIHEAQSNLVIAADQSLQIAGEIQNLKDNREAICRSLGCEMVCGQLGPSQQ